MIQVQVDSSLDLSFDAQILKTAARLSLDFCQPEQESDLTIMLTTDARVRELNHTYRNIGESTDVLSFSSMELDPDTGHIYLGDVIISYDKALTQSVMAGHNVLVELQLLAIHGTLHLLGYDHMELEQKSIMWDAQEKILEKLGLVGVRIITELE